MCKNKNRNKKKGKKCNSRNQHAESIAESPEQQDPQDTILSNNSKSATLFVHLIRLRVRVYDVPVKLDYTGQNACCKRYS